MASARETGTPPRPPTRLGEVAPHRAEGRGFATPALSTALGCFQGGPREGPGRVRARWCFTGPPTHWSFPAGLPGTPSANDPPERSPPPNPDVSTFPPFPRPLLRVFSRRRPSCPENVDKGATGRASQTKHISREAKVPTDSRRFSDGPGPLGDLSSGVDSRHQTALWTPGDARDESNRLLRSRPIMRSIGP